MLAVDSQTLADLLNKTSHGCFGLDKAVEIQQTAKNSFGIVLASSSFALIIRQHLEQLKSLESFIAAFDTEIARLMADFDTKLETITGIGTTLAAVIFSEIGGDIKKFSSVPKLVAYAGLYPKPTVTCPNAALLISGELCGLPPPLPLSKTLLSVFFTKRNAPRGKTI